jgi:hypothetical protein
MLFLFIVICVGATANGIDLSTVTTCSTTPCTSCQGPCTTDNDCENGYCFSGYDPSNNINVPGCSGTGVSGQSYCAQFKKLSTVLSSAPTSCNSNSELEIWANVGVQGAETFSLATESWKTGDFEVTGTLTIPSGTITSATILDGTITTTDIKDNTITTTDIKDNTITTTDIKDNTITTTDIKDGTITTTDIAVGQINSATILDGTITTTDIAVGQINSATILDGTITTADIEQGAVRYNNIKNGEIYGHLFRNPLDIPLATIGTSTSGMVTYTANPTWPIVLNGQTYINHNVEVEGWTHLKKSAQIKGHLRIQDSPTESSLGLGTDVGYQTYLRDATPGILYRTDSWDTDAFSIWATGAIHSATYIGASDRRIKKDIRSLRDSESLSKIRQLDTKAYKYLDQINRGHREVIGFIAQDVNTTIPEAVTTHKNFIPNEMRPIQVTWKTVNAKKKRMVLKEVLEPNKYKFKMFLVNDSKITSSETYDLITKDGKTFHNEYGEFTTEENLHTEVLLYGKEVDDFMSIDKQKIFAVAYSALQQVDKNQQSLIKRVTELEKHKHLELKHEKKDVKTLEATIKTQAALIAKLEQRLTALEKK